MDSLQSEKRKFAEKEIYFLVFQGALMRGYPFYAKKVDERRRMKFKVYLLEQLKKFTKRYPNEDYIKILNEFQKEINNSEYIDILNEKKITFGRVQKLLNLYLKYCWAFDFNKNEPPHCPIDSIILGKINWHDYSWSNPNFDVEKYKEAIDRCKKEAEKINKSVAQWELYTFRNRSDVVTKDLS